MQKMRLKSFLIIVIAAGLVASAAFIMGPHGHGLFAKVVQIHGR
jgi:hypothetical protein